MSQAPQQTSKDAAADRRHRLLLVDDDRALCEMLVEYLEPEGFGVEAIHDGRLALEQLAGDGFDLVILDVMLPGANGLDVLRELRSRSRIPVLMLTARGDDVDRIVGLEVGADDYLPKPFNPRELVARLRAILRRAAAAPPAGGASEAVEACGIVLDPATYGASRDGAPLALTGAEFRVLELLLRRAGTVVSRDELTEKALGRRLTPYDRAVDTHVSNLRRKLGRDDSGRSPIRNVRGAGYLFAVGDCTA